MDKTEFWKIIDLSRRAADGDPEQHVEILMEALTKLAAGSIVDFDRTFCEYHNRALCWNLWGAAHLIGGGCDDEGFADFRGWLISRGERVYEAALADPETLARLVEFDEANCQIPGFHRAAARAWAEVSGARADAFPRDAPAPATQPRGESWSEDDLEARYPKLAAKFA
ncbi:MAG: DUF4240 domain-containing protein [Tahibacter sp.]